MGHRQAHPRRRAAKISSRINRTVQARALAQFAALDGDMWQR
jgi:hypothetical protein